MAEIVAFNPERNQDSSWIIDVTGADTKGACQSFLGNNSTLTSCKFYLQKVGSPTGTLTAYLFDTTGTYGIDAKPVATGSPLQTGSTLDVSTVATSMTLYEFTFSGYTLTKDATYCIVIAISGGSSDNTTNFIRVGRDATLYDSGNACTTTDVTLAVWSTDSSRDCIFYVYGNSLYRDLTSKSIYSKQGFQ